MPPVGTSLFKPDVIGHPFAMPADNQMMPSGIYPKYQKPAHNYDDYGSMSQTNNFYDQLDSM